MPRNLDDDLDALLSIGAEAPKADAPKTEAPKTEPAAPQATPDIKPEGKSEATPELQAPTAPEKADASSEPPLAESATGTEPAVSRTPEQEAEILDAINAMGLDLIDRIDRTYDDKTAAEPKDEAAEVGDEDIEEEEKITVTVALPEEKSAGQGQVADESEIDYDQSERHQDEETGEEDSNSMPDSDGETRDEDEVVPPIPPTPPQQQPPPPVPPKGKEKATPRPGPRKQDSGRGRTPRIIQQIEDRANNVILALIAAAAVGGGAAALWPDDEPRCTIERPTREQLTPNCKNIPGTPRLGNDLQCKKNGPGFDCTARVEIPSQNLTSQYYRFRLPEVKQSVDFRKMTFEIKP